MAQKFGMIKERQRSLIAFSAVYSLEDCNNIPNSVKKNVHKGLEDISFSESDVMQLLMKINIGKSPVPDQIHPRVLKECAKELELPLAML